MIFDIEENALVLDVVHANAFFVPERTRAYPKLPPVAMQ